METCIYMLSDGCDLNWTNPCEECKYHNVHTVLQLAIIDAINGDST